MRTSDPLTPYWREPTLGRHWDNDDVDVDYIWNLC